MDDFDCFNLDELNDSLVVTTAVRNSNEVKIRSDEITLQQQPNEYHFDEQFHSSFETFVEKFMAEVILMKLQQKTSDKIFSLCTDLIKKYSSFLCQVFKNSTDPLFDEILSRESEKICGKFSKMNASHKRKKEFEHNQFYVQPTEKNLGIS